MMGGLLSNWVGECSAYFLTREKNSPEKKSWTARETKYRENCPRKKMSEKKTSKILPKKKTLPEKKIKNCARESAKSPEKKEK